MDKITQRECREIGEEGSIYTSWISNSILHGIWLADSNVCLKGDLLKNSPETFAKNKLVESALQDVKDM